MTVLSTTIVWTIGVLLLASRLSTPAFALSAKTKTNQQQQQQQSPGHIDVVDDRSNNNKNSNDELGLLLLSRRSMVTTLATTATVLAAATTQLPTAAGAFPNAIPEAKKYADRPKRKGDPPKDLGVLTRTTEGADDSSETSLRLRTCSGNPNCFSTTGDALLEDRQQYGVDFLIAPWIPPTTSTTTSSPLAVVAATIAEYEPGQGGVDGGGFQLIKQTDSYLYYQFEALKKGYIDDLEFAVQHQTTTNSGGGGVMVRSASRVGVTDFGVNAIRLNCIASKLRAKGWTIAEITPETHRDYWIAANEAREATFDEDRRRMEKNAE